MLVNDLILNLSCISEVSFNGSKYIIVLIYDYVLLVSILFRMFASKS